VEQLNTEDEVTTDMNAKRTRRTRRYLDVVAAYNREELPLSACNGLQVESIEEIMAHPYHWAHLTERDTEEVLMEIYVARRRRMQ
jgi:hypothetical protein